MESFQFYSFPECPKCICGKLLPISGTKIIYGNYDCGKACSPVLGESVIPIAKWKCSNCDHIIKV